MHFSAIFGRGPVKLTLLTILGLTQLLVATAAAQGVPQSNVNAIGPTPVNWLLAGNARKQQNEPECAVSSVRKGWLFCGFNDYRAVDFEPIGDAGMGVAMSRTDGRSWISGLHPGHRADSPSLNMQYLADANVSAVPNFLLFNFIGGWRDNSIPSTMNVARWYEHNRETGPPWEVLDIVTVETGTSGKVLDKPGFTTSLANPNAGLSDVIIPIPEFSDALGNTSPAFDLSVPAGRAHLVFSVFVGNDNNDGTKLIYMASDDWGKTWPIRDKISESVDINQGASITTRNDGDDVLIVWRRFSDNNESSAIMYVYKRGNKWSKAAVLAEFCAFDQPTGAARFRTNALPTVTTDGDDFYVFYTDRGPGDQTCATADGTLIDSDVTLEDDFFGAKDGKVPMALHYSRIMMAKSSGNNKLQWTPPEPVDPQTYADGKRKRGHQFMPAVTTAEGVTQLSWRDSRRDKLNTRAQPVPGGFIEDLVMHVEGSSATLIPAGAYEQVPPPAELPPTEGNYPFRRTIDMYGAQIVGGNVQTYFVDDQDYVASIGGTPQPSTRISRYPVGKNPKTGNVEQLEYDYPNGRLFRKGKAPFIGDYDSVFAVEYRKRAGDGAWVSNVGAPANGLAANPTFYSAFTSNRNVRGNVYYTGCDEWDEALGMWVGKPGCASQYGAPNVPATGMLAPLSGEEGEDSVGTCSVATPNALTRNQNIFVAAIRPELSLSVISATKKADGTARTYIVFASNASPVTRTISLSIPADDSRASFYADGSGAKTIDVVLPGRSAAVRTVFTFTNPLTDPTTDIVVTAVDGSDGTTAQTSLVFNAAVPFESVFTDDADNPVPSDQIEIYDILLDRDRVISTQFLDLENLDLENLDLENVTELLDLENLDLENLDLENRVIYFQDLQNLDLENLDLENLLYQQNNVQILDLENLDLENRMLFLDLENLDLENLDLENLDLENLDLENYTVFASDIANLDLENLDLENLDLENTPVYTEISWQLKTETNTSTGIDVKPIVTDALKAVLGDKVVQIFVTSAYETSTVTLNETAGTPCEPKVVVSNQVLFNSVIDPGQLTSATGDPDPELDPAAPSFYLDPDKNAIVSIRVFHDGSLDENFLNSNLGIAMYAQGGDGSSCDIEAEEGDNTIRPECEIDNPDITPPVLDGVEDFFPEGPYFLQPDESTFRVEWGPATANDAVDGNIEVMCTPGALDPDKPLYTFFYEFPVGSTEVTCTASDIAGNIQTATFTILVTDDIAPEITLTGANPQTVIGGTSYVELGATATDNADGSVGVTPDSSLVNANIPGIYLVTYTASDASGNVATETRTVIVTDTIDPVITLIGANPQTIEATAPYTELGATANDNVDGDIPATPDATAVNTDAVGTYFVTYTATDAALNTATKLRTVNVVDTTAPLIVLAGNNPITLEAGDTFVDPGATAGDTLDGDLTASIMITGAGFNTSVPDTYIVNYDVSDNAGNPATRVTRTVNVVDTTAPSLTLLGADPQTIDSDTPYVELGATAADIVDGDVSGDIVINASNVNTAVPGGYSVTYDVSDSNGNAATQAVRAVNVVDATAPVITIGEDPLVVYALAQTTEVDLRDNVSASDLVDGAVTPNCSIAGGPSGNIVDLDLDSTSTVNCSATDAAGNAANASYRLDVVFAYDIELIVPKGNPRAGSTVPIDWRYLQPGTSTVVDSSAISPVVVWMGPYATKQCGGSNGGSGNGTDAEDSGSSGFRYSDSNDSWKYNWQTPNTKGAYRVSVSPPGSAVVWKCVNLR